MSIYVIPDIHGQRAMLEDAIARIERDGATASDEVIFLGDYVDRGPDTRGVLEILSTGKAEGRNWSFLLGNHDRMMLNYLRDGTETDPRIRSGLRWPHPRFGGTAIASYGVDPAAERPPGALQAAFAEAVPESHRAFLAGLVCCIERDDLLFVHAGILPGRPLEQQTEDDLVWIRNEFLDHPGPHPWLVVHGHTPVPEPRHYGAHIDLDGGAGMGRPLAVAVVEEDGAWFLLDDEGRTPLPPRPLGRFERRPWD